MDDKGVSLFTYQDYAAYVAAQTFRNHRRLGGVWAVQDTIYGLADYLAGLMPPPTFGLCHGTRRGMEQQWFREKFPEATVLGTEIADTASRFEQTVQWDFHEVKPEWVGATDFIYTNSFDHAYDPAKAMCAWVSCLKPTGLCLIEWSMLAPEEASVSDPFAAPLDALVELIPTWAACAVKDVLPSPGILRERRRRGPRRKRMTIVVERTQ